MLNKIKRRRARALEGSSSSSSRVEGEWQFVNFNPFVYGPPKPNTTQTTTPPSTLASSSPPITGDLIDVGDGSSPSKTPLIREDYYEFPTSTKLIQNIITPPNHTSPPTSLEKNHHHHMVDLLTPKRNFISSPLPPLPPPPLPSEPTRSAPSIDSNESKDPITSSKCTKEEDVNLLANIAGFEKFSSNKDLISFSEQCEPALPPEESPAAPPPPLPCRRPKSWNLRFESSHHSHNHNSQTRSSSSRSNSNSRVVQMAQPQVQQQQKNHLNQNQSRNDQKRGEGQGQSSTTTSSTEGFKFSPGISQISHKQHLRQLRHHQHIMATSTSTNFNSSSKKLNCSNTTSSSSSSGTTAAISKDPTSFLSTGERISSLHPAGQRPETLSEESPLLQQDLNTSAEDSKIRTNQESNAKKSSNVGRSESCKEGQKKQVRERERRKHSDPNLCSKTSDVDLENHLSDANNSGSSSSSSLSARSMESPSTSLEMMGGHSGLDQHLQHLTHPPPLRPLWDNDSDIETGPDLPDWTRNVPEDVMGALGRNEKKRQEVLNELFHTERTHIRNLKVIDRLFYSPLRHQNIIHNEILDVIFANIEEIIKIHEKFNAALKKKRNEDALVGDVGHLLLEMFDGEAGENFKHAAGLFCARQQTALETLKERRKKDQKFHLFLTESESDPVCRRLGLKDMLPMGMHRLTKYPLLFQSLCNYTPAESGEWVAVRRAVELSRAVLAHVNQAKRETEDGQRLAELQRRLDKPSFDRQIEKSDPSIINELKNLDFTKHRLIYESPLIWRMQSKANKQKSDSIEVQAVLLHDMIVLLLKQDDRYVLKIHNISFSGKTEKLIARPIIRLNNLILREVAADKNAFFLMNTTSVNMYELVCTSTEDRKIWLHHIGKAAEDFKNRQQDARKSELLPASIPFSIDQPEDRNKSSSTGGEGGEDLMETSTAESSPQKDVNNIKDPTPTSPNSNNLNGKPSGDQQQQQDIKDGEGGSPAPAPPRRPCDLLRIVVESPPLVEPTEVVVASHDVQFAETVISHYGELKRMDSSINKALDEKLKIVSKILNIPPEEMAAQKQRLQLNNSGEEQTPSSSSAHLLEQLKEKNAKDLVLSCIYQVDQLGKILNGTKITGENMGEHIEHVSIQKSLNILLSQLLNEVERSEEESRGWRLELQKVREQNHGYHERLLHSKNKISPVSPAPSEFLSPMGEQPPSTATVEGVAEQVVNDLDEHLKLPAGSGQPLQSRPSSFLSATSSSPDDTTQSQEGVEGFHLRTKSAVPSTSPLTFDLKDNHQKDHQTMKGEPFEEPPIYENLPVADHHQLLVHNSDSAGDLAHEEFADAMEDLVLTPTEHPENNEAEKLQQEPLGGHLDGDEVSMKIKSAVENGDDDNEKKVPAHADSAESKTKSEMLKPD